MKASVKMLNWIAHSSSVRIGMQVIGVCMLVLSFNILLMLLGAILAFYTPTFMEDLQYALHDYIYTDDDV